MPQKTRKTTAKILRGVGHDFKSRQILDRQTEEIKRDLLVCKGVNHQISRLGGAGFVFGDACK